MKLFFAHANKLGLERFCSPQSGQDLWMFGRVHSSISGNVALPVLLEPD